MPLPLQTTSHQTSRVQGATDGYAEDGNSGAKEQPHTADQTVEDGTGRVHATGIQIFT